MRDVTIRVEVATLSKLRRIALLQATEPETVGLIGARFVDRDSYPTEGEFRAATADALAKLLDEVLES